MHTFLLIIFQIIICVFCVQGFKTKEELQNPETNEVLDQQNIIYSGELIF